MKLQNVRLLPIIIVILTLGCVAVAEVYDARLNNKEILTPASADAPLAVITVSGISMGAANVPAT